jgi:hypothetical protein
VNVTERKVVMGGGSDARTAALLQMASADADRLASREGPAYAQATVLHLQHSTAREQAVR